MQNQECQGRSVLRGGRRLYNCCKELWLGGQRNNQLKALMASDGVAVQGRWNQRLGLQLEWEVPLTMGLGLGQAVRLCGMCVCCQQWRNGVCNFMQLFPFVYDDFLCFVRVSLCESFSILLPFGCRCLGQTKRANFKLAERSFLLFPPALLSTFLSQSHE